MIFDERCRIAVDEFWEQSGERPRVFPCDLESMLSLALPAVLVKISHLRLGHISEWLWAHGCVSSSQILRADHTVRGCVVAWHGRGVIFLDGQDSENERRFTLAHEIAHFLLDYLGPRKRAQEKFGNQILQVLDGERPPTTDERLHSLLTQTPLTAYINLFERSNQASHAEHESNSAEIRADQVALMLLAPEEDVWRLVSLHARGFVARRTQLTASLQRAFGLPKYAAALHSSVLLARRGERANWVDSLRD